MAHFKQQGPFPQGQRRLLLRICPSFLLLRISLINENKSHWHKGALLALTVLNRKQTQVPFRSAVSMMCNTPDTELLV